MHKFSETEADAGKMPNETLASRLTALADDIQHVGRQARTAYLNEAAKRLSKKEG